MSTVLDKFLRYVKIDTQSQDGATTVPSTDKQRNLASLLAQELNDMGAQDVVYDKAHCYVYATIPSNLPEGKTGACHRLYFPYGYVSGGFRRKCQSESRCL